MIKFNQIKSHCVSAVRAIAGRDVTESLMVSRNFRYYKKHQIIFIHVPKNAGSSISRSLYGRSLGHWPASKLRSHDPDTYSSLESFAILRHPVERAISAWKYCRSGGTSEGWVKDRPEYHIPQFETFERFALEWLPEYISKSPDFVFQSQSSFLCDEDGKLIVDRLISIHDLGQEWENIVREKPVFSPELSERNRNQSGENAGQASISPAVLDSLKTIYREDFALFEGQAVA